MLTDLLHHEAIALVYTVPFNRICKEHVRKWRPVPSLQVIKIHPDRGKKVEENGIYESTEREEEERGDAKKGREGERRDAERDEYQCPGISSPKKMKICEKVAHKGENEGQECQICHNCVFPVIEKAHIKKNGKRNARCKHWVPCPERHSTFPNIQQ
jgi:hypothetical protein